MASGEDKKIIEKLKKMLISRDTSLQMSSVDFICNSLNEKLENSDSYGALMEYVIVSDVCIYLGEASATLHSKLLTVNNFNLPSVISTDSCYDSIQILNMLQTVVDKDNASPDTILVSCKALHSMIALNQDMKLNLKTIDNVTMILKKYLSYLCIMFVQENNKLSVNDYFSCTFGMICHLSADSLKLCDAIKVCLLNKLRPNQTHNLNQNMENLIKVAHESMVFIVVKIKRYEEYLDFSCYETFLKFLNLFFHHESMKSCMPDFGKTLLNNGFLVFLPMLRAESKNHSFRKLCQTNLAELLVILSLQNFNFAQWNGGESHFQKHLYEGLLENEDDLIDWPRILFDKGAPESILNSLMIFLYFYCISPSSSQEEERMFLPHIVCYILSIPNNTSCPLIITKCLWLIFAITSSSGADLSQINGGKLTIEKANYKLSKLISANVKDTYTHHTSIVSWAFSSARIPFSIQNLVLQLWLEKEKELPSNLISVSAVWWSLLDLIQNAYESVVEKASEVLKYCITNICDETSANKIKISLWKSLPDLMTYYVEDEIKNEKTLMHMLEICSSQIPTNPDMDVAFKSAFLLTEILPMFDQNNDDLFYNFLTEAFCLLNVTLKQENTMVLSRFTSTDSFIDYVYIATKKLSEKLSIVAYKIFSTTAYYLMLYKLNPDKVFNFEPEFLVKALKMEKSGEKCLSLLQLIHTSFHIAHQMEITPFITIKTEDEYETMLDTYKALFFRLQMMCCKESKLQYESSWQCLNSMLLYCALSDDINVINTVAAQPWTHVLIRYYFSQNETKTINIYFLNFIFNWLTCLRMFIGKKKQRLEDNHNFLFKTISLLVSNFNIKACETQPPQKAKIINNILNVINIL